MWNCKVLHLKLIIKWKRCEWNVITEDMQVPGQFDLHFVLNLVEIIIIMIIM